MTTAPVSGRPSAMQAHARLRTESTVDGSGQRWTRLAALRSQAPLTLRPTIRASGLPAPAYAPDALHVCRTAGAAGPMGGDDLTLDIEVGAGSALVLTEASATLLLPGPAGERSRTRMRVRIRDGATLLWLPQPMIAARACHHLQDVDIEMAASARLLMREELLLGRRNEASGRLHQRTRVSRDGTPLLAQDLCLGDPSGTSPAIVGDHRAVGSMLLVDPDLPPIEPQLLAGDGALLPLAGDHAVLAQALARDSISVRGQLDSALAMAGPRWGQRSHQAERPTHTTPDQESP